MLDHEDRVKLTDLGIASAAQATGITTTGTILGTPAYMAPEMFDGDRATDAADVYSVAAIAFEMLTGRRAREGGTPAVVALRAATEPPPDVRDVWPEAAALAAAIAHGMARDPAERPASATALVDEIAAALEEDERAPVADADGGRAARAGGADARGAARPEPPRAEPARREPRARGARTAGAGARSPAPPRAPLPRRARRRRGRRLAIAAIAAVLLAGGGSDPERGASSTPGSTSTGGRTASTPSTRTSTAGTAAAAPAPTSPTGAVQAFYGRAAAHRYDDAWALAAPGLRQQLGGFAAFRRQFSTVRSIVFSRASEVRRTDSGATVAVATTATHTDHVDHCAGTADTAARRGRRMGGRPHRDLVLTQRVSRVTTIAGSLMTSGGSLMRRKTAVALVALASLVIVATAVAQSFPGRIDLPRGWQPEGIAAGTGNTLYVGSIPTGAVARVDARTGRTRVLVAGRNGRAATGLKFAGGRLFVAGAGTGRAWVYSANTGRQLAAFRLAPSGADTFVNDVVVTPQGAYFTDSRRMVLYRVPLDLGSPRHADRERHPAAGGQQPQRHRRHPGRAHADRRSDEHREALADQPADGRRDRGRPRRRDRRQRRRPAAVGPHALRRAQPRQPDRGRAALVRPVERPDHADDHEPRTSTCRRPSRGSATACSP